jgi:molybdopterin-binding protein
MNTRRFAGLSARNQLQGTVEDVEIDGLMALVRLRIGDQVLTSVITAESARDLRLARGKPAVAIIKSTEVMIAVDDRAALPDAAGAPRPSATDGFRRIV